jgi:predicted GIY-YIG superfamily endonuclease
MDTIPLRVNVAVAVLVSTGPLVWGQTPGLADREVDEIVRNAYLEVHNGWSSDEVLLNDALQAAFLSACARKRPELPAQECNWRLLNLRKAGQLPAKVTRRRSDRLDDVRPTAEIVTRFLLDKYRISSDAILCNPNVRREFDRMSGELAPGVDPYLVRKAALGLRKARRLRPELVLRVADWDRQIMAFSVGKLRSTPELIPELPGVYLFRDSSGYLYIGEASNLRTRLKKHLDASDRTALASYLDQSETDGGSMTVEVHAFSADSRARELRVRRAYESELISSRNPRFNVRP